VTTRAAIARQVNKFLEVPNIAQSMVSLSHETEYKKGDEEGDEEASTDELESFETEPEDILN
jgi:hypothetical protein